MNISEPFAEIDSTLEIWLKKYGLTVYKRHFDEDVRLIPIVDNEGATYNISIVSEGHSKFEIQLFWVDDNDKRIFRSKNKKTWKKETNAVDLERDLDEAYKIIEAWSVELGHQRTWD